MKELYSILCCKDTNTNSFRIYLALNQSQSIIEHKEQLQVTISLNQLTAHILASPKQHTNIRYPASAKDGHSQSLNIPKIIFFYIFLPLDDIILFCNMFRVQRDKRSLAGERGKVHFLPLFNIKIHFFKVIAN